jgi:hypothetical protein
MSATTAATPPHGCSMIRRDLVAATVIATVAS